MIHLARVLDQRQTIISVHSSETRKYGGFVSIATDVLDEVKAMPELGLRPKAINDFNGNRHTQQLFQVYREML